MSKLGQEIIAGLSDLLDRIERGEPIPCKTIRKDDDDWDLCDECGMDLEDCDGHAPPPGYVAPTEPPF